jgi:hypothetical protein
MKRRVTPPPVVLVSCRLVGFLMCSQCKVVVAEVSWAIGATCSSFFLYSMGHWSTIQKMSWAKGGHGPGWPHRAPPVQYTQDIWIQSSNYSAEVNNANTESEIKFDMRVVDENIFEVLKKDLND